MEEIDFEQLKVVLEGQNDIEIISKINFKLCKYGKY